MSAAATPLTLEALAALLDRQNERLAALEQENQALRATLATQTAPVRADDTSPPSISLERLSRRWLLRRGVQAAAATVAAGALWSHQAQPASAGANQFGWSTFRAFCDSGFCGAQWPVIEVVGDDTAPGIYAHSATVDEATIKSENTASGTALYGWTTSDDHPSIWGENFGSDPGVYGRNAGTGPGILGETTGSGGTGVRGNGPYGVWGESAASGLYGVVGKATGGTGVWGQGGDVGVKGTATKTGVWGTASQLGYEGVYGQFTGSAGYGVVGDGKGATGVGVVGRNPDGTGVLGQHTGTAGNGVVGEGKGYAGAGVLGKNPDGPGVYGQSSATGYEGVFGQHTGANGYGVVGAGTGTGAGVVGKNSTSEGVLGDGNTGVHGKGRGGPGVYGESAQYGGQFKGAKAQLRLMPPTSSAAVGAPTQDTHAKGELYLDYTGTLFVCTAPGTPGTWRKVSMTLA